MDFLPWYRTSEFRIHEAACLMAGEVPLSKRVPDREELPSRAIPAYVALATAYVLWVTNHNRPEDPNSPRAKMLMGSPQLDSGEITLAVPLAKLTGEFVSRDELRRWILATGSKSEYPFSPLADQPATAPTSDMSLVVDGMDDRSDSATPNWKMKIQAEATEFCLRLQKSGASPTKRSILDPMVKWCKANGVKTDGHIFPSANYLRTHVLGGKHWDLPR